MDKTKSEETKSDKTKSEELVQAYIASFTPEQKKVHEIAIRILESSYSVEKSIGFLEFKKASENRWYQYHSPRVQPCNNHPVYRTE